MPWGKYRGRALEDVPLSYLGVVPRRLRHAPAADGRHSCRGATPRVRRGHRGRPAPAAPTTPAARRVPVAPRGARARERRPARPRHEAPPGPRGRHPPHANRERVRRLAARTCRGAPMTRDTRAFLAWLHEGCEGWREPPVQPRRASAVLCARRLHRRGELHASPPRRLRAIRGRGDPQRHELGRLVELSAPGRPVCGPRFQGDARTRGPRPTRRVPAAPKRRRAEWGRAAHLLWAQRTARPPGRPARAAAPATPGALPQG